LFFDSAKGKAQGKMTRIYLVRHGTTEWNREEIFRGRAECRLNETGLAEARALADYFAEIPIEAVFTSPLSRALETARPTAESQGRKIVPDPAFTDLDFGAWQGLRLKEAQEQYPDLYRLWRVQPGAVSFPGGENLAQVRSRAWEGLLRLAEGNPQRTILIVTHRVVTKVLICAALGLDDSRFWQVKQDSTAINCLEYSRGIFNIALVNDTCHLKRGRGPN
jgi:probable phosphoglycerate mutase